MRWCLRVKLAQNFGKFFNDLLATKQRPIVEQSRKDRFGGAVSETDGHLHGENRLGILLMDLRAEVHIWLADADDDDAYPPVLALDIENFLLPVRLP